jgi:hypothetical protein
MAMGDVEKRRLLNKCFCTLREIADVSFEECWGDFASGMMKWRWGGL